MYGSAGTASLGCCLPRHQVGTGSRAWPTGQFSSNNWFQRKIFLKNPSIPYNHNTVPFGATLPFALIILPRFLGGDGDRRDGGVVRGVMELGILASETDNSELIHVHCCFSLDSICSSQ